MGAMLGCLGGEKRKRRENKPTEKSPLSPPHKKRKTEINDKPAPSKGHVIDVQDNIATRSTHNGAVAEDVVAAPLARDNTTTELYIAPQPAISNHSDNQIPLPTVTTPSPSDTIPTPPGPTTVPSVGSAPSFATAENIPTPEATILLTNENTSAVGNASGDEDQIRIKKRRSNQRRPGPLQLQNLGSTCYLNSGLQVLWSAQKEWQDAGYASGVLGSFMSGRTDLDEFVYSLGQLLRTNLRHVNDTRKIITGLLTEISKESPAAVSPFQFTRIQKRKVCLGCSKEELFIPQRGPPNSYFLYVDGSARTLQERIRNTFFQKRECMECDCPEEKRDECQNETVTYEKYPEIALLCTSSGPSVQINAEIDINSNMYKLLAYTLSLDGHAISFACHEDRWYECNDSHLTLLGGGINEAISKSFRGEPVFFAYKKI